MLMITLDDCQMKPKARPRVTANGTFMPGGYQDWRNETRFAMVRAMQGRAPLAVPLSVTIQQASARRGRGDIDNMAGGILDAGNGVIWQDDRHIQALSVCWLQAPKDAAPSVVITVRHWNAKTGREE